MTLHAYISLFMAVSVYRFAKLKEFLSHFIPPHSLKVLLRKFTVLHDSFDSTFSSQYNFLHTYTYIYVYSQIPR